MKELVVISGKGGTGKTTLVASFAALAERAVLADCDVDAADLHLLLVPTIEEEMEFRGGYEAHINDDLCTLCGYCWEVCRFGAVDDRMRIQPFLCEGCGVCSDHCPAEAISMERKISGRWFVSETRFGPMVHAELGIAQESSGKLVAQVRRRAKEIAEARDRELVIVDGSPGIGCPVISSITGAHLVLVVIEPTQSGLHDLERVLELTNHFNIPAAVCVNKYDLNVEVTDSIERLCANQDVHWAGTIPYDLSVTSAMIEQKSLIEFSGGPASTSVRRVWALVNEMI